MNDLVILNKRGKIADIVLNRPERMNAICEGFPQQLAECVKRANDERAKLGLGPYQQALSNN